MFWFYILKRKMALFIGRSYLASYILVYTKLKVKHATHRIVGHNTKLVIEGPPRCGNSSGLRVVTRNNISYKKRVATHLHRSFQLFYAMKNGIPAVVMLRDPESSTISHASLLCQLGQVTVNNATNREQLLRLCVKEYLSFVRDIHRLGCRHIMPFEEYVQHPESLIDYVNRSHHLNLSYRPYDANEQEAVHVYPSEQRETLKQSFMEIAGSSPDIKKLMQLAKKYYDELISERFLPDVQ